MADPTDKPSDATDQAATALTEALERFAHAAAAFLDSADKPDRHGNMTIDRDDYRDMIEARTAWGRAGAALLSSLHGTNPAKCKTCGATFSAQEARAGFDTCERC